MPAPAEKEAPKRNRSQFIRTEIPLTERVATVICLLLLVGIGVAIYLKGKRYDPALYALRTDALKSTVADVEGKGGTIRGEAAQARGVVRTATINPDAPAPAATTEAKPVDEAGYDSAAPAAASAAAPAHIAKREQLVMAIAGIKPMSDTEFYDAEHLYEKIDGRAPAYLGFNFLNLRCRSFEVLGGAGSYVDVYEYYFDTPVNAFGMFAAERDAKGASLDFAPDGYSGEMGYFFRQGTCYVQIIASDTKPKTMEVAKAIAQDRAKAEPVDDTGLDARRRLPATGLDPKSVEFTGENALGQDFLKNTFSGKYDFGGKLLPFFIMVTKPDEAAAAWKSFADFSAKYGGKLTPLPDVNGAKIFLGENAGLVRVIFQRDGELGGVFDSDDGAKAREFVEQYLNGKIP